MAQNAIFGDSEWLSDDNGESMLNSLVVNGLPVILWLIMADIG